MACRMWHPPLYYMTYSLTRAVAWELTVNLMDNLSRRKKK